MVTLNGECWSVQNCFIGICNVHGNREHCSNGTFSKTALERSYYVHTIVFSGTYWCIINILYCLIHTMHIVYRATCTVLFGTLWHFVIFFSVCPEVKLDTNCAGPKCTHTFIFVLPLATFLICHTCTVSRSHYEKTLFWSGQL